MGKSLGIDGTLHSTKNANARMGTFPTHVGSNCLRGN